tara:strand:+ start:150 stop:746 length:597 start_codon:yes stop_codon:yes gene_type:complete
LYLSKLHKFILKTSFKNLTKESLGLESDAIHKFLPKKKEKEKKIDIINTSIDQLLEIKENSISNYKKVPVIRLGKIELDSNTHAHIYFYEPIIHFFGVKPKDKFIDEKMSIPFNISERRKRFEVKKRKYIRKSGNHKRGVIRGECKFLKKYKASLSRSISSLLSKKLIRKISIVDFNNKEIGIGYNLTKNGKDIINAL